MSSRPTRACSSPSPSALRDNPDKEAEKEKAQHARNSSHLSIRACTATLPSLYASRLLTLCVATSTSAPEPESAITPTTAGPHPAGGVGGITGGITGGLRLLLSLDVALELIYAEREVLKRCDVFAGYPWHYGHCVANMREELIVLFLRAFAARHVVPGFGVAIARMNPARANGDADGERATGRARARSDRKCRAGMARRGHAREAVRRREKPRKQHSG